MAQFIKRQVVEERWEKIQSWLKTHNYNALVVLETNNTCYVSGWYLDVEPWERPVATVIPASGEPFMILHELSTHHVKMAQERGTIYIDDITFYFERPSTTRRTWTTPQWPQLVANKLKEHGLDKGDIASDLPAGALAQASPRLTWHTTDLLHELRAVKHPDELELMRQACSLANYGQEVFRDLVKPGKFMTDVDAETVLEMIREGAKRFPGCDLHMRCFSLTGPDSASPHGTGAGSSAVIEAGHGIVNIIVGRLNHYNIENERTYFVGHYNETQKRAFECVQQAQAAAVAACVPGNPLSAVDAAAQTVIEAGGFADNLRHRTGHGIGLRGHDRPADIAFNHRPLEANEVYTIEPGIYIYGVGGFRHDDTVIVGDPPEVLTTTPKDIESMTLYQIDS
jgi:Xaa-Pro aminopeptidase